jgi:large conductance mechanosensitive channel
MLKGFKEFIMRGNVIDLAVAFVIGLAFAPIVTKIVEGLITPLISRIFGQVNLDNVGNVWLDGKPWLLFGPVLSAVFNFLAVAAAIYFLIVVPMNAIAARRAKGKAAIDEPSGPTEIELLTEIRDALKK